MQSSTLSLPISLLYVPEIEQFLEFVFLNSYNSLMFTKAISFFS